MKKEQGIGIKMKSDNGQVLTVAFRPKTKDWWVSARKGHKGTKALVLSQEAIDQFVEMYKHASVDRQIYPLLDLKEVSWQGIAPKKNAPQ